MRAVDRIGRPLSIRSQRMVEANPCANELATLFSCWRALEVDHPKCAESVKALCQCMSLPIKRTKSDSVSDINKWLSLVHKNKRV